MLNGARSFSPSDIPFADLVAMDLLSGPAPRDESLGVFVTPNQLGFVIPVLGIDTHDVVDIAGAAGSLFHMGTSSTDQAATVWKNIRPTDYAVLDALGVEARPDGWYKDGRKLTQEESDFLAGGLMASLIGAYVPAPKTAWLDNQTGRPLSNVDAWTRWTQRYGAGATLQTVLNNGAQDLTPFSPIPSPLPGHPAVSGGGLVPLRPAAPGAPIPGVMGGAIPSQIAGIDTKTILLVAGIGAVVYLAAGRNRS